MHWEKKEKVNDFIVFTVNFPQINSYLLRVCTTETAYMKVQSNVWFPKYFLNIKMITSYFHNEPLMVGWTTTSISGLWVRRTFK